jgi:hypothetical protein
MNTSMLPYSLYQPNDLELMSLPAKRAHLYSTAITNSSNELKRQWVKDRHVSEFILEQYSPKKIDNKEKKKDSQAHTQAPRCASFASVRHSL